MSANHSCICSWPHAHLYSDSHCLVPGFAGLLSAVPELLSAVPEVLLPPMSRLAADQGDNPVALQDALIELEKDKGPSHWIGSKIPASISSSKIWRAVFWVRHDAHLLALTAV